MDDDVDAASRAQQPWKVTDIANQVAKAIVVREATLNLRLLELVTAKQTNRLGIVTLKQ
jgi:hypothetical protein